jgi:hypothetical protein
MFQPCNTFTGCPDIADCNGTLTQTYSYLGCSVSAQAVRAARRLGRVAALRRAIGKAKAVSRLAAG